MTFEESNMPTWPQRAVIVGCGTMGLGVAECFLTGGIRVRLVDATPELSASSTQRLVARVRGHVEAGLLDASVLEGAAATESSTDLAEAVGDADLVFEAVTERFEIKRDVLGVCANNVPAQAVIVSNTSSLPIDDLATCVARPDRFLGMHWFNPPEWTPGIEVIPGMATDPVVVQQVMDFLVRIGKRPSVVGSGPGFVANRLQFALFQEAVRCVEDGLASPEEVDAVVRSCFGFRLPFFGPFQIADMAGLDVYANVFDTLERGLGERFKAPDSLRELVEQGRKGTKNGEGYFRYTPEESASLLLERDRWYASLNKLLAGQ
jgi:3-hydroxybutyryl-CoA dehydrogenase